MFTVKFHTYFHATSSPTYVLFRQPILSYFVRIPKSQLFTLVSTVTIHLSFQIYLTALLHLRKREIVHKKNQNSNWPLSTLMNNYHVLLRNVQTQMELLIGSIVQDAKNGSTIYVSMLTLKLWMRPLNITAAPVKLNV